MEIERFNGSVFNNPDRVSLRNAEPKTAGSAKMTFSRIPTKALSSWK
jgi:hypothetical protein